METRSRRILIFLLLLTLPAGRLAAQDGKPNVILIYTDDQGTMDLGIYGASDLATPNLDRLARSGTRFTNFHSSSPICSPSRASLMTGRYPQRAGLAGNAPSQIGEEGMPASQFTMAELFKSGGYATAHIGKWHLGYAPETMPNQQGFDYSFGFMGGCIDNYSHYFYWQGPNRHDLWRNGREIWEPGRYFPDLMVEEASLFLENNRNKPFFMYFAINAPHYPLQGEVKWLEHYKDLPSPRRQYAAFVSTMDEKIGNLLGKVDELGLSKNTIIIFQADQGHSTEERTFGGGGYAGAWRGSKFSLFEGGTRVPAFVSWPGHIPQNAVRSQFATNLDWFPTLASLCGIPLPDRRIDGKNLTHVISSEKAPSPHKEFYWESGGSREVPQWAVWQDEWKLLHNPTGAAPGDLNASKLMLVNLKADSTEAKNLADKHPDAVQRLQQKYRDWRAEVEKQ